MSAFNTKREYSIFEYLTHECFAPLSAEGLNRFTAEAPTEDAGPWRLVQFHCGQDQHYADRVRYHYIFERERHVIEYL